MEGATPGIIRSRDERRRTIDAQRFLPVFLSALLIIAAFGAVDVLLVRVARHHRTETAARVYERAIAAREQGKLHDALELFRRSLNENPSNFEYQLAFAEALRAVGRVREAVVALERLLSAHPAHGGGNAEMARLLAAEGDWQNAAWYYHRALFGEWNGSPDLRKLRFELADLLARHGAREQLLAEVVLLTATPLEPAESRKLAQLLLAAEDWVRAERQYRLLLRQNPEDPYLLVGLARAQTGAGRHLAAERSFRRAVRAGIADAAAEREMKLVAAVNDLNPTLRGLGASEKHRRAHEVASRLVAALKACSPDDSAIEAAETSLARHGRVRQALAAAEEDLDLFDQLWRTRQSVCSGGVTLPPELELLGDEVSK